MFSLCPYVSHINTRKCDDIWVIGRSDLLQDMPSSWLHEVGLRRELSLLVWSWPPTPSVHELRCFVSCSKPGLDFPCGLLSFVSVAVLTESLRQGNPAEPTPNGCIPMPCKVSLSWEWMGTGKPKACVPSWLIEFYSRWSCHVTGPECPVAALQTACPVGDTLPCAMNSKWVPMEKALFFCEDRLDILCCKSRQGYLLVRITHYPGESTQESGFWD